MFKFSSRVKQFGFLTIGVALLAAPGSSLSAQSSTAPVLIPYTTNLVAGNPYKTTGGYSGDGGKAVGTQLNAPGAVAVDASGNIYIADTTNGLIREVNPLTGTIQIVAGLAPTGCVAGLCTANPGYVDGGPALSSGIGTAIHGMAIDGFGNIFFSDTSEQAVRVLYKGGTQVANLIALEDPTAAATASAVVPGNIYLIAGHPTTAVKGTTGGTDNVLATSALFHNPGQIGLDGAGNIYVQDVANGTARVINAQSTTQTFFGYPVPPGYIKGIVDCGVQTATCGISYGIGAPTNQALFGAALAGMSVDKYGNVYMLDTKGADPIYAGVAYASGSALANLINVESGAPPTSGNWYVVINANPNSTTAPNLPSALGNFLANRYALAAIRPSSITADPLGNIYYLDNHWPALYRVDVNSQVMSKMNDATATTGTALVPAQCSSTVTTLTSDSYGDGCPVGLARLSGFGQLTTDSSGNVYVADATENLVRMLSVNNHFPSTAVGTATPTTQTLQVHFDQTNLPVATTPATTTSPLAIAPGSDFSIQTAPTCSNLTSAIDTSIDCVVVVTFAPKVPGLRTASLQATALNGTTYNFPLSGLGVGPALAIDGGTQAVVSTTGLGAVSAIAIDSAGNQYLADSTNNRVVKLAAGTGIQTAVGTGLSKPQGVAVDITGNIYIADTGHNQVVEVLASTGAQVAVATGLSSPQAVAVDKNLNVYIADTGNARIYEIPAGADSPATLLQFSALSASSGLKTPTSLAVDGNGNLYIADPGAKSLFELPPGGGDLASVIGPTTKLTTIGTNLKTPSGVSVDAAGDVYISDSTLNVVVEQPASTGPGSEQFNLSFTGLSSPSGLALDPSGNLYVADTGNSRVLSMNRAKATVNFGNLALYQPALTAPLTVGNIGNAPLVLSNPAYVVTGNTADFSLADKDQEGCPNDNLLSGLTCTINAGFMPVASGPFTESVAVQGGAVNATLIGTGIPPVGVINVALTQAPVLGGTTAQVTATVTQPHGTNTPTGTVTFAYTINEGNTSRGGSTGSQTITLVPGSGGTAVAVFNLTGLLPARRYAITATYNGDSLDSANTATVLTFTVPSSTLTVVAPSVTFVYGGAVPSITGTVTGILPADAANITYTFTTPASSTTAVGVYPVNLVLSGGNYLNYVVPPAVTSTGAPTTVTETPAPLSVVANSVTTVFGANSLTYTSVITGIQNGDPFTVTYNPPKSGVLDAGTYPLIPTLKGPTSNYTITTTNGVLTVNQAGSAITYSANAPQVLPTNLPSELLSITVGSATTGTPSGTVTITDTFTPLLSATANAPVTLAPLTLVNGGASYTPTSQTFGTHVYSIAYSGDKDFVASTLSNGTSIVVDNPDYFLTTPPTPLLILPGTLPGGNQNVAGENAAVPEQATITFTPILGYTGTVNLTCTSPSSYVTCSFSNTAILITSKTAQTSVISVQTPATLPINYSGALRLRPGLNPTWAFLPLGLLAMLPFARARKERSTRYLWLVMLSIFLSLGLSGCGTTNLVKFYTPVPQGEQPLTITANDGVVTKTLVMTINIQ